MSDLPRLHIAAASLLSFSLLSLIFIPSEQVEAKRESSPPAPQAQAVEEPAPAAEPAALASGAGTEIDRPETAPVEAALPEPPQESPSLSIAVKSGDTLASLFQQAGLSPQAMYEVLHSQKQAKELARLSPGNTLHFTLDDDTRLQSVKLENDPLHFIEYRRGAADDFVRQEITLEPQKRLRFANATINDSLFLAGYEAELSDKTIMNLANIFGWDIDFILDIREGDSFTLLYEEHYHNGEKLGDGPILAASFTNKGKTFQAVRYTDADGQNHYFTPEGRSMRKEFLRNPVDFARISSRFNLKRKHPILNRIRAHKGVDYAAPRGTPIRAAGDGKVIFAGMKGGWGRTLIIQHGQKYQTLYAHLNAFNKKIRRGSRVKQGQTVAYVGSTGLATGPHLHYEFRVNGAVRNPLTVQLPKAKSIAESERLNFAQQTAPWLAQLEQFNRALAFNESQESPKS